jgi:hypothetical protein
LIVIQAFQSNKQGINVEHREGSGGCTQRVQWRRDWRPSTLQKGSRAWAAATLLVPLERAPPSPRVPGFARRHPYRASGSGFAGLRLPHMADPHGDPTPHPATPTTTLPSPAPATVPRTTHVPSPPAVCTICLDPITLHSATHRSEALWPGCRHPYHLACLARTRARMPNPVCALCRQPWPPHEDSALSLACNCRHQPLLSSRVLDGKVIVIVYLPNMWQVECRYITCKLT